jgi:hypothetical protein
MLGDHVSPVQLLQARSPSNRAMQIDTSLVDP